MMAFPNQMFGNTMIQPAQYQQPANTNIMTVLVQGEAGAQMYPVAAGNTVLLADFDAKLFWLKGTAANGVPQPLRKFKFEEITPQPAPQVDPNAVSRQEFDELKSMIAALAANVGGKQNEPAKRKPASATE